MNNKKSLLELTEDAIQKEEETSAFSSVPGSIAQAVRDNLDVWEQRLFPLLKIQRKPAYAFLAKLFAEAGYENVTPDHLATCIWRERKLRSKHAKSD